jgi:hypothetical protein
VGADIFGRRAVAQGEQDVHDFSLTS